MLRHDLIKELRKTCVKGLVLGNLFWCIVQDENGKKIRVYEIANVMKKKDGWELIGTYEEKDFLNLDDRFLTCPYKFTQETPNICSEWREKILNVLQSKRQKILEIKDLLEKAKEGGKFVIAFLKAREGRCLSYDIDFIKIYKIHSRTRMIYGEAEDQRKYVFPTQIVYDLKLMTPEEYNLLERKEHHKVAGHGKFWRDYRKRFWRE